MELTALDLLTVPGAAAVAVALTTTAKWFGLPGRYARTFVKVAALLLLVAATLVAEGFDVGLLLVSLIPGVAAGLAAVAGYDATTSGADYAVIPADDYAAPLGPIT